MGIRRGALAQRFPPIRFIHIADCYGDHSLRAQRVKSATNSIKIRGQKRREVPFNADFLRWIHSTIDVNAAQSFHIAPIWAGLLAASSFASAFRSYSASLNPQDVKFPEEPSGVALSISKRTSKTDQDKRGGVTLSLRANPSIICPVRALYALQK